LRPRPERLREDARERSAHERAARRPGREQPRDCRRVARRNQGFLEGCIPAERCVVSHAIASFGVIEGCAASCVPRPGSEGRYRSLTAAVIDAITPDAVLNGPCSVFLIPWRRAIQMKSV
jgi:hypothetical protein